MLGIQSNFMDIKKNKLIEFNTLRPSYRLLKSEIDRAVKNVLESGWYVLGPELESFEKQFAKYHGLKHAVGVANGTDAIELSIRALGIGRGDEVITVSHTAVPTVCAIERAGAKPVLVDVDPMTFTMDPAAAEAAITPHTKAILPVHLYGCPADMDRLGALAKQKKVYLIEDCAQAHGALYKRKLVGTFGQVAAFSFYPTKNMGAFGDGGMVITNNQKLADRLRRLRTYGEKAKYENIERGVNSRLDEIQAAILKVKLRHLNEFNRMRMKLAQIYLEHLDGVVTPTFRKDIKAVYHLFVIRYQKRDQLQKILLEKGIKTAIHYPKPIHLQEAYSDLGYKPGSLPVTEKICNEILSLPMYIGLTENDVKRVLSAINKIVKELDNEKN